MLFLFLGYIAVSLYILFGLPLEGHFSNEQFAVIIVFSVIMDFFPVILYWLGRKFSKTSALHWPTLLGLGVIIGVICQVLMPGIGVMGYTSIFSAALFFAAAFLPSQIEFWIKGREANA